MSDKFRKTYPLKITFGQGEQPSNAKLSAISEQTRNGLDLIERVIGDAWAQSGDEVFHNWPLWIPNLARQVGQNEYMNLALPYVTEDFLFTEHIGDRNTNKTTGHLVFKPKNIAGVPQMDSAGGGLTLVARQDNEHEVTYTTNQATQQTGLDKEKNNG